MKKLIILTTFALVAFAGADEVKSKRGTLELTKTMGGSDVACAVDFNDVLTVIKQDNVDVLVKGKCQGWVPKSMVEKHVKVAATGKNMNLDNVDITGWIDNPSAVFVLDNNVEDMSGVNLDRNFKEYLNHTEDREKVEHRNGEY